MKKAEASLFGACIDAINIEPKAESFFFFL